jgi:small subunit ribosomal protein S6
MSKAAAPERPYETMLICPSETPQKAIDEFVDKIKKSISDTKGTFNAVQVWGRRRFTYPIKRHREGLYVFLEYKGSNSTEKELSNLFRVSDVVLRHLTTEKKKVDASAAKPAAPAESGAASTAPASTTPPSA